MPNVTTMRRKFCLAMLLGLLVGYSSVAWHTAAHAGPDAGDCEICLSYGDVSEALANPSSEALPPAVTRHAPVSDRGHFPRRDAVPVRQRGPPLST